jgi:hypothetical protein
MFADGNCPSPGLLAAPKLENPGLSLISNVKPVENILPLIPVVGANPTVPVTTHRVLTGLIFCSNHAFLV